MNVDIVVAKSTRIIRVRPIEKVEKKGRRNWRKKLEKKLKVIAERKTQNSPKVC